MCIISGCDYVNSLQGLGLKTAYKLVKMAPSLQHVLKQLRRKGHALDGDYEAQVIRAEQTFLHQVVWDPVHQTQRHLTDPPAALADKLAFAGTLHRDPAVARALAIGDAHPVTEEMFEDGVTATVSSSASVASMSRGSSTASATCTATVERSSSSADACESPSSTTMVPGAVSPANFSLPAQPKRRHSSSSSCASHFGGAESGSGGSVSSAAVGLGRSRSATSLFSPKLRMQSLDRFVAGRSKTPPSSYHTSATSKVGKNFQPPAKRANTHAPSVKEKGKASFKTKLKEKTRSAATRSAQPSSPMSASPIRRPKPVFQVSGKPKHKGGSRERERACVPLVKSTC
eukprot:m.225587 g.225587  ORF g.225587 m.225587 type:complete len:344 (-) comp15161_c0_seq10:949-1980(-)